MKKKVSLMLAIIMLGTTVGCNAETINSESTEEIVQTVSGDATLLEAKSVLSELGYDINYERTSKTLYASRKKRVIKLTADSDIAVLNGENIKMNAAAEIDGGVFMATVASLAALTGETIESDGTVSSEESQSDDTWKDNKITVNLDEISDDIYTITDAGVYTLSGSYEGMIYVNSTGRVKLILNGADITNNSGPAVYFENSDKSILESAEGSENNLTDGSEYSVEASGCVYSNADIDIQGTGTINITANYNHGIASDNDIKIEEGTLNITTTVGDAIHAKDGVSIKDGSITVSAMGDGISGDKYVEINDGTVDITTNGEIAESSGGEAFMGGGHMGGFGGKNFDGESADSEGKDSSFDMGNPPETAEGETGGRMGGFGGEMPSDMGNPPEMTEGETGRHMGGGRMGGFGGEMPSDMENSEAPADMGNPPEMDMQNGRFNQSENAASESEEEDSVSSKGIKSENLITINGGEINVNATDHCIKSDNLVVVNGGDMTLTSEISKGIKALGCIFINDGNIDINTKDEGIESKATVTINGGNIDIVSKDDGINAGGGSGTMMMNNVQDGDEHQIVINGGFLKVNATGDGLDSNGNLYFYGGEVVINGPTSGGDGSLDSAADNIIYGGTLFAIGSVGMVECPESGGEQNVFNIALDETQSGGSTIKITNAGGSALYEMTAEKDFQSIIFSSADITAGEEYYVYINDELFITLTAESGITKYGSTGGMGGGRGSMGGGQGKTGGQGRMQQESSGGAQA